MKSYWSQTRFNGQPIEPGTFCRVIDLEDGSHPIYVYGATQEECFEKIERQNANAQLYVNRQRATPPQPPTPPRTISADQIMQATSDLENPAKSAAAVATLLAAATGTDPVAAARQQFGLLAKDWEDETPDFYPHKGNRQLVGDRAIRLAHGKPGLVTREMLDSAFQSLKAEGLLFERPIEAPPQNSNAPTLTAIPAGDPGSSFERPRGTRFSTGVRSSNFSAPQTATTRTLKYTEEQIRTMSEKDRLRVFDDPDYIAACDFYYSGGAQARA